MLKKLIFLFVISVLSASVCAGSRVDSISNVQKGTQQETVLDTQFGINSNSCNLQQSINDKFELGILSKSCCKICSTGKACGNSCISRSYNCHQPAGCACNG